jgi:fatty-acyl-CoA synthase
MPSAQFDADGLCECRGGDRGDRELRRAGGFEGYYNNPEADAERMRDGVYWTGDLGYRDAGVFYCGRSGDWLRRR